MKKFIVALAVISTFAGAAFTINAIVDCLYKKRKYYSDDIFEI